MPYVVVTALLVAADQLMKLAARVYLSPDSMVTVIPNFIDLTLRENRGIAFSLFADMPESIRVPLAVLLPAAIVLGLVYFVVRHWASINPVERWGFSILLAGALGNLIDRSVLGHVTDFMYWHFYDVGFFVNNFADDLITIGVVLVAYSSFFMASEGKEQ